MLPVPRNAREAAFVVEAVFQHMESHPEESLGVVTLNFEQRELIEELLDERLRTDPFALAYQERMNVGPEPFFVKNLENAQGDERDVIFISVTPALCLGGQKGQKGWSLEADADAPNLFPDATSSAGFSG